MTKKAAGGTLPPRDPNIIFEITSCGFSWASPGSFDRFVQFKLYSIGLGIGDVVVGLQCGGLEVAPVPSPSVAAL